MPGTYNITVIQGGTFSLTISAIDDSNNNILASATEAKSQIRETLDSSTVLAEMTCVFASNNAFVTISLDPTQTANLNFTSGFWDLRITWPDKVEYLLAGKAKLAPTVTRNT